MAIYAVGDIQGCYQSLVDALAEIDFSPSRDTLWVAGDLINRGPQSLRTLRYLYKLGHSCKAVLGNHDLHFLAVAAGQKPAKSKDTFSEILEARDLSVLKDWLHSCPLIHADEYLNYVMVHAGIPPQWDVSRALTFAEEIHGVLRSPNPSEFFAEMYGNEPDQWSPDLTGNRRFRVITNYFTRMRFCDKQGRLELTTKTGPEDAPKGFKPWFKFKHHACLGGPKVLFGHWAALLGKTDSEQFIGLDTGCVWGGDLTFRNLETHETYQYRCCKL